MAKKDNEKNKKNKFIGILLNVISVILIGVIIFCGYQIWEVYNNYAEEEKIHEEVMIYKPSDKDYDDPDISEPGIPANPDDHNQTQIPEPKANQSIVDAKKANPDVVGWLTIPNTKIDYPFVQAKDNLYYVDHNFKKEKAKAGSIFVDFRCSDDFSDFNTIMYGHHMKNGSMFGTLKHFQEKKFFDSNKTGKIYLEYRVYDIEIFAYMIVHAEDNVIYKPMKRGTDEFLKYVREKSTNYREIGVSTEDKIVTLSTCGYSFEDARLVLIGRLKHSGGRG